MLALVAAHAGEAAFEIAAVEELVDDLRDNGAQKAVAGLVALHVHDQERVEMPRQALPERRLSGPARTIDLLHHANQCEEGVCYLTAYPKRMFRHDENGFQVPILTISQGRSRSSAPAYS